MNNSNKEIEARFLEVDKESLIKKLKDLGAVDEGEGLINEKHFIDQNSDWVKGPTVQYIRVRTLKNKSYLTFKKRVDSSIHGTTELEIEVSDYDKTCEIMLATGLKLVANRQKLRHTFKLDNVAIDIDTWPKIPAYAEIEGESEEAVKEIAAKLGFDWSKVYLGGAAQTIIKVYNIPFSDYQTYTFEKIELRESE
jgi:adenylate cyclase class 2